MNSVAPSPLADKADVVRGVTFSKGDAVAEPREGYTPVLRAGNIQGRLILDSDLVYIPKQMVSEKQRLRRGDIVMCTSSGSAEIVGKTAFAEHDWSGSFGAFCAVVRPKPGKCNPRYLFHYLQTPNFRDWTRNSSGVGIKNIRKSELDSYEVPFPGLDEQRRIASILDQADVIRRKRGQALALADDFLRSAYLHIVGMKHPEFLSWEPFPIESLAKDKRGSIRSGPFGSALLHSEFVDEGIAVLGIDNAVKNKFQWAERRFITREKYEELRRYRVYPNDVIITIMGTTGRSAVVPDDIPEAITTKHLASITCDPCKVLPEFLSFAVHSDPVVIDQIRAANKGAIMDGLNLGIIRQIKIRKPPMRQQRLFADLSRKTHAAIQKMTTPTGDGSDLFASLSQRAFRGEL
jgi:type I restriction enzyme S subunit